jgi:sulfite exporter TauE/SafE
MTEWAPLLAAFTLGLISSAHCIGMCGGIMGALTMAIPAEARHRRLRLLLSYNFGRIASYTLMGALVGLLASGLGHWSAATGLRIVAGVLLITMGLYLADWWRGLVYLERGGRYLWAYLQPLGKGLLPVRNAPQALLLGMVWGWLPCGLVYSALAYAMVQAHPAWAAAIMLAFGLGTLPAVLATGLLAQQLTAILQRRQIRTVFALLIMVFGVWTLMSGSVHHQHHHTSPSPADASPSENHHNHSSHH